LAHGDSVLLNEINAMAIPNAELGCRTCGFGSKQVRLRLFMTNRQSFVKIPAT
jgi:hypothetical protein